MSVLMVNCTVSLFLNKIVNLNKIRFVSVFVCIYTSFAHLRCLPILETICNFQSCHRFVVGIWGSGFWLDHSNTICFDLNNFMVVLTILLQISCLSVSNLANHKQVFCSLAFSPSSHQLTNFPVLAEETNASSRMLPPPCFTMCDIVGDV